jgi:thymidylate synthase (FAD)
MSCTKDVEGLCELIGRVCYKSFDVGLNANLTSVRKGNHAYITNVIKQRHGSVFEHTWATFALADVSRVFTHEVVRHRVGTGISQESLRFVRVDDVGVWLPTSIAQNEQATALFTALFVKAENTYAALVDLFAKHDGDDSFHVKKTWTSAIRRVLPQGMATNIIWSTNMRNLRHVIEARTHPGADEEIRMLFGEVGRIARLRWPNLFCDYTVEMVDGHPWYRTENQKI